MFDVPVTSGTLLTRDSALLGFLLSLTPLSCDLMGWRGAGGNGAASTGVYFGFGAIMMLLGAIGEVRECSVPMLCAHALSQN